jgi:hypothetical protein
MIFRKDSGHATPEDIEAEKTEAKVSEAP